MCLGIEMVKEERGIQIHQAPYISEINEVAFVKNGRAGHDSLDLEDNKMLKIM